MKKLRNWKI